MLLNLDHIGQIALAVGDVDRAEAFYRDVLKLRKLYRFGDLTFFDWRGVSKQAASDRQDGRSRFVDGVLHRPGRPHTRADAGSTKGLRTASVTTSTFACARPLYANADCSWAEQCHIVPSPLVGPCGGGTGRGVQHAPPLFHICN